MRSLPAILTAVCYLLVGSVLAAQPDDIVRSWIEALTANSTSDVARLYAASDETQIAYALSVFDKAASKLADSKETLTVLRSLIDDDCSIVLIEARTRPDGMGRECAAICLVEADGQWAILPSVWTHSCDEIINRLSDDQRQRFNRFEQFFRAFRTCARKSPEVVESMLDTNGWVGTWSNGRSEFATSGFGLRGDGRGYFGAAVATTLLRWTNTTDGILVTLAGDGSSTNLSLQYDSRHNTFVLAQQQAESITYFRVNTNEPPDFEARYEAAVEEEQNNFRKTHPRSPATTCETSDEFLSTVRSFAANEAGIASMFITSANGKSFTLQRLPGIMGVLIDIASAGQRPKHSRGAWSATAPPCEHAVERLVPEERVAAAAEWMTRRSVGFGTGYVAYKSMWGIEGYVQSGSARISDDPDLAVEVIRYVMEEMLAPFEFPLTLTSSTTGP